ncbi:lipopolysaccharide biosynthesis protein [Macellibacteroides fermentans]|uniref:lipopolysaccharide biosynthesis protein n=1 Tax=Macellibacteroides fermentans TaxID=879969 RepID=UPI003B951B4D
MASLGKSFVSGVIWGTIEKFSSLLIGFLITVLLARKLTPSDYGLVNMIQIFTVFGMVLIDGGFGQALIQKKDANSIDYSTIFYLNIILSIAIYVFLYFLAPYIAEFYRQPALVDISRVVFLLFPINAFCLIQHTKLTKEMKIKHLTVVSVVASIFSGLVGLCFAYSGYGVWALVYQTLALYSARSLTLWYVGKWYPKLVFSFSRIKAIWGFSMNLLGTFTLAAVFQNIYTVFIGRYFSLDSVGYYNQAFRFESIATGSIAAAVQRVSFPAFAEIQNDKTRLRLAYEKVMGVTMFIHLPIMLGIASIGHDMFYVLLTEKWLPAVPYFYLLCIGSSLYPLHMINVNVIKALGKGKLYFRLNLAKYAFMSLFIIITINETITMVLLGFVMSTILSVLYITYYCGKEINYPLMAQLRSLVPIFAISIVMVGCIIGCSLINIPEIFRLVLEILVGCSVYVILSFIFKLKAFNQLLGILKHK